MLINEKHRVLIELVYLTSGGTLSRHFYLEIMLHFETQIKLDNQRLLNQGKLGIPEW